MRTSIRQSALLAMGLWASAAVASPITFTISGVGTGVFAGQPFSNAAYSISMTADTSDISIISAGLHGVIPSSTRVEVPGLSAVGSFTNNVLVVANQGLSSAGFGDVDQDLAIEFLVNPALSGYNLATPIGPLSGEGRFNPGSTFPTTAGEFGIQSVTSATFSAQAALPCYANCDNSTVAPILNVNDFQCFLNKFAAADPYANCDQSTSPPVLNVNDFQCFLNKFAVGCS